MIEDRETLLIITAGAGHHRSFPSLFHESAVLEQVWLCQAKHPMLVPDGAKECAELNGEAEKGRTQRVRQRE